MKISLLIWFSCSMTIKIATPPMLKTPSTITAKVIINEGFPPYHYLWGNNEDSSECILSNSSQIITVTITDSKGCIKKDTLIIE